MKVITINEECHGFIGIAKDMPSAFHMLLSEHWITDETEFYTPEGQMITFKKLCITDNRTPLMELLCLYLDLNHDWFDGMFSFSEECVYEG